MHRKNAVVLLFTLIALLIIIRAANIQSMRKRITLSNGIWFLPPGATIQRGMYAVMVPPRERIVSGGTVSFRINPNAPLENWIALSVESYPRETCEQGVISMLRGPNPIEAIPKFDNPSQKLKFRAVIEQMKFAKCEESDGSDRYRWITNDMRDGTGPMPPRVEGPNMMPPPEGKFHRLPVRPFPKKRPSELDSV